MKKIKYLLVEFENELALHEVPFFRAAIIERTQRAQELFHNHRGERQFVYRYPLIQYKSVQRRAALVCLEGGTEQIHALLGQPDLDLRIGNRTEPFTIDRIRLHHHRLQLWQDKFSYRLVHWQALNQENYRRYQALAEEGLVARIQFLERILVGNLLSLCAGLDCYLEERLELRITDLERETWLPFKGRKVLAFTLTFQCNLSLPDHLGVGKGVSVGLGRIVGLERRDGSESQLHAAATP